MPKNDFVTVNGKNTVAANNTAREKELLDLTRGSAHAVTNVVEDYSVKAAPILLHMLFDRIQIYIDQLLSA